jgi:hypothetical protein
MAAHAVKMSGFDVMILSNRVKSPLYGAQYLHAPIPGITDRDAHVTIDYLLRGSVSDYRRKVYGRNWDGTVSPEDLSEPHSAWDIRATYDRLWERYRDRIQDMEIDPAGVHFLQQDPDISLVINTIPLSKLCHQGHTFRAQEIVAAGDAPQLGIDVGSIYHCPPDTVICNGEEMPTWYRISRIFGHTTVEWPSAIKPPIGTASKVLKPTAHNCDCWPDMLKVGRYGSWTKGVLSNSAFNKVMERIEDGEAAQAKRYNNPDVPTLF